nr:MAG: hypothetical protein [Bacteriophage sp.]
MSTTKKPKNRFIAGLATIFNTATYIHIYKLYIHRKDIRGAGKRRRDSKNRKRGIQEFKKDGF